MVAITVILAAVIGSFVLGLGEQTEREAQAGINVDVDDDAEHIDVTAVTFSGSDYVLIRGAQNLELSTTGNNVSSGEKIYLDETGQSIRLTDNGTDPSGELVAVAVIGDPPASGLSSGDVTTEDPPEQVEAVTTIQTQEYDFS